MKIRHRDAKSAMTVVAAAMACIRNPLFAALF